MNTLERPAAINSPTFIDRIIADIEPAEKLMRRNAALEAPIEKAMRHAEGMAKFMCQSAGIQEAMRHAEGMAELMRPSPAIQEAMRHAEGMAELMRPSPAIQEAMRRAEGIAELVRPSPAIQEAMRHLEKLFNPNDLLQTVTANDLEADSASDSEPELISSRELEGESLIAPANHSLIRVCAPSLLALRQLFHGDINLEKISWRNLEEIVGDLLSFDGYEVEIGRGSKDGGVDVHAWKLLPYVGLLRTVWQAKHIKSGNKVELRTIRELADVRDQEGATKGIIVTTGFLSAGALKRIRQDAYRLGKVERPELENWIRNTLKRGGR